MDTVKERVGEERERERERGTTYHPMERKGGATTAQFRAVSEPVVLHVIPLVWWYVLSCPLKQLKHEQGRKPRRQAVTPALREYLEFRLIRLNTPRVSTKVRLSKVEHSNFPNLLILQKKKD